MTDDPTTTTVRTDDQSQMLRCLHSIADGPEGYNSRTAQWALGRIAELEGYLKKRKELVVAAIDYGKRFEEIVNIYKARAEAEVSEADILQGRLDSAHSKYARKAGLYASMEAQLAAVVSLIREAIATTDLPPCIEHGMEDTLSNLSAAGEELTDQRDQANEDNDELNNANALQAKEIVELRAENELLQAVCHSERLIYSLYDGRTHGCVLCRAEWDNDKGEIPYHEETCLLQYCADFRIAEHALSPSEPKGVQALADKRELARQAGDFAEMDRLRKLINKAGYSIIDGQDSYKLEPLVPQEESPSPCPGCGRVLAEGVRWLYTNQVHGYMHGVFIEGEIVWTDCPGRKVPTPSKVTQVAQSTMDCRECNKPMQKVYRHEMFECENPECSRATAEPTP